MHGMELGLLLIRVGVGVLMMAHGAQKLLGWFNGYGVAGTGGYFESLGYPRGRLMAVVTGLSESGAGTLLALGLATPLAAAGLTGLALNIAVAAHGRNGFWNHNQPAGWEYPMVLGTVAAGIGLTGPGRYALDAALHQPVSLAYRLAAIGLGIVAGAAFLALRRPTGVASSTHERSQEAA